MQLFQNKNRQLPFFFADQPFDYKVCIQNPDDLEGSIVHSLPAQPSDQGRIGERVRDKSRRCHIVQKQERFVRVSHPTKSRNHVSVEVVDRVLLSYPQFLENLESLVHHSLLLVLVLAKNSNGTICSIVRITLLIDHLVKTVDNRIHLLFFTKVGDYWVVTVSGWLKMYPRIHFPQHIKGITNPTMICKRINQNIVRYCSRCNIVSIHISKKLLGRTITPPFTANPLCFLEELAIRVWATANTLESLFFRSKEWWWREERERDFGERRRERGHRRHGKFGNPRNGGKCWLGRNRRHWRSGCPWNGWHSRDSRNSRHSRIVGLNGRDGWHSRDSRNSRDWECWHSRDSGNSGHNRIIVGLQEIPSCITFDSVGDRDESKNENTAGENASGHGCTVLLGMNSEAVL
nr:hypothetical protein Iba_chr01bCG10570 [Ipomoea batatas]